MKLGRIVKTPLQKYTHLTAKNGYLTEHLSKQFHEDSLSRSNACVALVKSNAEDVEQQANVAAAKQRKKNRMALKKNIFFQGCGSWKRKRWKRSFFCGSGSRSTKILPFPLPHRLFDLKNNLAKKFCSFPNVD